MLKVNRSKKVKEATKGTRKIDTQNPSTFPMLQRKLEQEHRKEQMEQQKGESY